MSRRRLPAERTGGRPRPRCPLTGGARGRVLEWRTAGGRAARRHDLVGSGTALAYTRTGGCGRYATTRSTGTPAGIGGGHHGAARRDLGRPIDDLVVRADGPRPEAARRLPRDPDPLTEGLGAGRNISAPWPAMPPARRDQPDRGRRREPVGPTARAPVRGHRAPAAPGSPGCRRRPGPESGTWTSAGSSPRRPRQSASPRSRRGRSRRSR